MTAPSTAVGGDTVAAMGGGPTGETIGRATRGALVVPSPPRAGATLRRCAGALAGAILLLGACTDDAGPTVAERTSAPAVTDGVPGSADGSVTTTTSEMRPVPTVPPSTLAGQTTDGEGGVVDASPTIAPVPIDPNEPTTSVVPPTTDLVGDPQPDPDTTSAPPPPPPTTTADDPDACERLAQFDVAGVIADEAGVTTAGEPLGRDACRYAAGVFVAEVHFVAASVIRDDWNQRDGIEPVGEVSSSAVGFSTYVPPGSPAADGYTIAVEGGSLGVVVAVTGTPNPRRVAAQVAIFANQAA